jgi:Ca2+-binding RTX toxin-like protein
MTHLIGTQDDDQLAGDGDSDLIEGLAGNDFLMGGAGDDTVLGGSGDDSLIQNTGTDLFDGGAGDDRIFFDPNGRDTVLGGAGDDYVLAVNSNGAGFCTIDTGDGGDLIAISDGYEVADFAVRAGAGNDLIQMFSANSLSVDAGDGNDRIWLQGGVNLVRLGAGHDVLELSASLGSNKVKDFAATGDSADTIAVGDLLSYWAQDWDPGTNPFSGNYLCLTQKGADAVLQMNMYGEDGENWITVVKLKGVDASELTAANLSGYSPTDGTVQGGVFRGGSRVDVLLGTGGDDRMFGGAGDDTMDGQLGDDILAGGADGDRLTDDLGGSDHLLGEGGADTLTAGRWSYAYTGDADHVTLDGGEANDQLYLQGDAAFLVEATALGGAGDDWISLSDGATAYVVGGGGADAMESAASSSVFVYEATADSTAGAADTIQGVKASYFIDLSQIDANANKAGDQVFKLVDTLSGHAGELALAYDALNEMTWVEGDVNGDGVADLLIGLQGDHADFANFVL